MTSVTTLPSSVPAAAAARPAPAGGIADIGDPTKMADHEVTFSDVLSTLNPLQYIPVIGNIYRAVTGDKISPAAQVLGGALLGGPLGLVASAANAVLEQSSGQDVGERVIAWLTPDSDKSAPAPQYAANTAPAPATTATAPEATPSAPPAPKDAAGPPPEQPTTSRSGASAATATPAASPAIPGTTPQAPGAVNAVAAEAAAAARPTVPLRTAGGAGLAGAVKTPNSGWTLADYRTFAGHGVPPPAGANGAQINNTPVPLQTTIPLPGSEGTVHAPVVPALVQTPANVAPATPAATAQQQDTWVSQAMMRGLDRYRDMMRQQEQPQQQPSSGTPQPAPGAGSK